MFNENKKTIIREVNRITLYPNDVIDFMSNKDNWISIDPDASLGSYSPLSYPDEIYVLNISNAKENVFNFFLNKKNKMKHEQMINEDALSGEYNYNITKDDEIDFEENGHEAYRHVVFALSFLDSGEEDIANKKLFVDGNHLFIFNGLDYEGEDNDERLIKSCLNVENIEIF